MLRIDIMSLPRDTWPGYWYARSMFSFLIRDWSVVRLTPSFAAAPTSPPILPPQTP